jgi:hypothetical protein
MLGQCNSTSLVGGRKERARIMPLEGAPQVPLSTHQELGLKVPAATSCLFGRTWAGLERTPGLKNDMMHAQKHMHVGRMQAYKPSPEARRH